MVGLEYVAFTVQRLPMIATPMDCDNVCGRLLPVNMPVAYL